MYPDRRVSDFISSNFVPVKIHVKEQPDTFKRFGVQWTPTLMILDSDGKEQYRFEGYLPPEDFLAQVDLGLAKSDFAHGAFADAERRFREIVQKYSKSETAAEAAYWAGVSKYKASGDAGALRETAAETKRLYPASSWTKKASVWAT